MEQRTKRNAWRVLCVGLLVGLFIGLCCASDNGGDKRSGLLEPRLLQELEELVSSHKNNGDGENDNVNKKEKPVIEVEKVAAHHTIINVPPRQTFTGQLSDRVKDIIQDYKNNPAQIPHPLTTIFTNVDARNGRDFLYFLHIPKTAGQTFHAIMRAVLDYHFLAKEDAEGVIYNWGPFLSLNDSQLNHFFNRPPEWWHPDAARVDAPNIPVTIKPADIASLSKSKSDFVKRTMMSKECALEPTCWLRGNKMGTPRFDPHFACSRSIVPMIQNVTLFRSHYDPFDGLCGHFDTSLIHALAPRKVSIVTFFRNPFSRFMSWYNYLRSNAGKAHDCINRNAKLPRDQEPVNQPPQGAVVQGGIKRRVRCPQIAGRQVETVEELHRVSEQAFETVMNTTDTEPFRFQPFSMPYSYSPERFMNSLIRMDLNNYATKAMSGCLKHSFNGSQAQQGLSDEEILEISKAAVDSASFVGLAERWNDSVQLFLYTFGFLDYSFNDPAWLPGLLQSHRNKSHKKFDNEHRDIGDLKKKVEEVDYLDVELYAYAEKVFEERFQNMLKMRKVRLGQVSQ